MMKRDRVYHILVYIFVFIVWMSSLTGCSKGVNEPISKSAFLLSTVVTVTLYDSQDKDILDGSLDLCREYEERFSKNIVTSEVYEMNHRGEKQTFSVSKDTADLLRKALNYSEISNGAFDITIEPLSSLWNFTGEEKMIPEEALILQAVEKVGYENVLLEGQTVTFLSEDTTIELGAIAKGFIADRMKEYLLEQGVTSGIINLGGNVLCIGEKPDQTPFKIGLQKPFEDRSETIATLNIRDMSVVSSGVYERNFMVDNKNYHHILDPNVGYPYDNGLISVTIISKESVDGDGLSTTCLALGLEEGMKLIHSLEGVFAVFITDDYELHYTDGVEELIE